MSSTPLKARKKPGLCHHRRRARESLHRRLRHRLRPRAHPSANARRPHAAGCAVLLGPARGLHQPRLLPRQAPGAAQQEPDLRRRGRQCRTAALPGPLGTAVTLLYPGDCGAARCGQALRLCLEPSPALPPCPPQVPSRPLRLRLSMTLATPLWQQCGAYWRLYGAIGRHLADWLSGHVRVSRSLVLIRLLHEALRCGRAVDEPFRPHAADRSPGSDRRGLV